MSINMRFDYVVHLLPKARPCTVARAVLLLHFVDQNDDVVVNVMNGSSEQYDCHEKVDDGSTRFADLELNERSEMLKEQNILLLLFTAVNNNKMKLRRNAASAIKSNVSTM